MRSANHQLGHVLRYVGLGTAAWCTVHTTIDAGYTWAVGVLVWVLVFIALDFGKFLMQQEEHREWRASLPPEFVREMDTLGKRAHRMNQQHGRDRDGN